tara:strand:- start:605 stop:922 length:318 start_codon:yes stop_codon:yes gene_type:complete
MNNDNNWKEVSQDISKISNKIKDNLSNEENINDLKESLNSTKDSIKKNFLELSRAIEETVKDEDIKKDVLDVVERMKNEFYDSIKNKTPQTLNPTLKNDLNTEEE